MSPHMDYGHIVSPFSQQLVALTLKAGLFLYLLLAPRDLCIGLMADPNKTNKSHGRLSGTRRNPSFQRAQALLMHLQLGLVFICGLRFCKSLLPCLNP